MPDAPAHPGRSEDSAHTNDSGHMALDQTRSGVADHSRRRTYAPEAATRHCEVGTDAEVDAAHARYAY